MIQSANAMPEKVEGPVLVKNPFNGKTYNFLQFFKSIAENDVYELNEIADIQFESITFMSGNLDFENSDNLDIKNAFFRMFSVYGMLKGIEEVSIEN